MWLLLLSLGCIKSSALQAPGMAPSANLYLRNSIDTDPSSYLGRFLPAGLQDVDESSAMTLACSKHVSWRFVDGGGVRTSEVLQVSSAVSARMGIPLLASAKGQAASASVARVHYILTGKMISEIADPDAFAACCKAQPDQCSDRMIGEFLQGTGTLYHEATQQLGASGQGTDPSSGVSGGLEVSQGRSWQRAAEFPNPVYFAFKINPTAYVQAKSSSCPAWVDQPPQTDDGFYVVGVGREAKTEDAARRKALTHATLQALQSAGAVNAMASGIVPSLQAESWCVEPTLSGGQPRFVAKVLAHLSAAELSRLQAAPSLMDAVDHSAANPEADADGPAALPTAWPTTWPTASPGAPTHLPAMPVPKAAVPGFGEPAPTAAQQVAALLLAIQQRSFDSDKLAMLVAVGPGLSLSIAELSGLLRELSFDADRVKAVQALAPTIRDPNQAAALMPLFSFSSDQDAVRAAFR